MNIRLPMQGGAAPGKCSPGAHRPGDARLRGIHVPEVQGHRVPLIWASITQPCPTSPGSASATLPQAQLPLVRASPAYSDLAQSQS